MFNESINNINDYNILVELIKNYIINPIIYINNCQIFKRYIYKYLYYMNNDILKYIINDNLKFNTNKIEYYYFIINLHKYNFTNLINTNIKYYLLNIYCSKLIELNKNTNFKNDDLISIFNCILLCKNYYIDEYNKINMIITIVKTDNFIKHYNIVKNKNIDKNKDRIIYFPSIFYFIYENLQNLYKYWYD